MKLSGLMPDITLAQSTAVVGWVVTQLVAFGVLDGRNSQLVVSAGGTFLFSAWHLADALIRNGRAKAVAANPSLVGTTTVQK